MSDYVRKALDRIQHPNPKIPQYAPHRWSVHAYGLRLQMAQDPDDINLFDKNATNIIQSIVGIMLYYARLVYLTMLKEINGIFRVQSRPTWDTEEKARMLLDYASTYPYAILRYKDSDMVLDVDSDATYLTMPKAQS